MSNNDKYEYWLTEQIGNHKGQKEFALYLAGLNRVLTPPEKHFLTDYILNPEPTADKRTPFQINKSMREALAPVSYILIKEQGKSHQEAVEQLSDLFHTGEKTITNILQRKKRGK